MRQIPLSFILGLTHLSWDEAAWGYRNQYIEGSDIVDLACYRLAEGEPEPAVAELAGILEFENFKVGETLNSLAGKMPVNENSIKSKWLYLRLAWAYENRELSSDPLGVVEEIYSDFDYPEEVAQFVRYMPVTDGFDPSAHSAEENHSRLLSKWRGYIETHSTTFMAR